MTEVLLVIGYFGQHYALQNQLKEAYAEGYVVTSMTQGEGKLAFLLERTIDVG